MKNTSHSTRHSGSGRKGGFYIDKERLVTVISILLVGGLLDTSR